MWDLRTRTLSGVSMRIRSSGSGIASLAISSDGTRLVTGSDDCTVSILDLINGETILSLPYAHTRWISSVAFTPDGARIVSGSGDGTIHIMSSKTGEAIGKILRGHSNAVSSIDISPDGTRMVSCSWDQNIFITTIKDSERDLWKQNCRAMDAANGWVKDGEKLLFWVPQDYRHLFRGNVDVWIRDGIRDRMAPKVDTELLGEISGKRWTEVYVGKK